MADLRAFIVQYLALPGAILKVSFIGQLRIPEVGSAELPYSWPALPQAKLQSGDSEPNTSFLCLQENSPA